jgi:hypothetical protein
MIHSVLKIDISVVPYRCDMMCVSCGESVYFQSIERRQMLANRTLRAQNK